MKKFVLKLDLSDNKDKRKALKTVSALSSGIDEISIDMKGKTLTVIGTVDPISVVSKLRKFWPTDIIAVGPAKEKEEDKKDETKNEEETKEKAKKEEEKKKEEAKMAERSPVVGTILPYRPYYPPMSTYYNVNHNMEENPNACVIS